MAPVLLAFPLAAAAVPVRVTGQVQEPGASAQIEIFPAWEDYDQAVRRLETGAAQQPLKMASPGPDGSFEIAAPETGVFRLVIRMKGRLTMEHPLVPLVEEVGLPEVQLSPPQPEQPVPRGLDWPPGWWFADSESDKGQTRFRVEVRDGEGKPVPGAVVRRNGQAIARTGADGRLEVAIPEGFLMAVEGPDGWSARLERPAEGQTAVVKLQPPRRIAGRVVDAHSKRPLSGALVWVGRPPATRPARSGDDGVFQLALPAGEDPTLEAAAAGYLPLSTPVKPGEKEPVVLALEPSATLSGMVVDGAGRPVSGATVQADPPRDAGFPTQSISARSSADGRFRLTGLRASGTYRLKADHEDFARVEALVPTAPAGQPSQGVRLVMGEGQTVTGRVVDENGRPVSGVMLALFRMTGEGATGISDAEGRFQLHHLSPGGYEFVVTRLNVAPVRLRRIEVPAGQPVFDVGDVELSADVAIEGRVIDTQGNPVARARISVHPANDDSTGVTLSDPMPEVETAADGTFRVPGLERGVGHYLGIQHPKYVEETLLDVKAPSTEKLQIVLRPGRSLAGQVVGPGGEPVEGASVSLLEEAGIEESRFSFSRPLATTDPEGRFRADRVPPGVLTLQVDAGGYLSHRADGFLLPEEKDVEGLKIVLDRGFQLDVQVLNARGEPVPQVTVWIDPEPSAGTRQSYGRREQLCGTDSRGRCRIAVPKAGAYTLRATSQSTAVTVRAETAGEITPLEIRLPAGVEVSGRVIGDDGGPTGMAFVQMRSAVSDFGIPAQPDGTFRFSDIADGQYRLSAVEPLMEGSSASLEIVVAGRPVRDLELRIQKGGAGAVLTGRVLGLEPGEEKSVYLSAVREPLERSLVHSGRLNAQGEYRIPDLEAGEWRVSASTATGRSAEGTLRIDPGVKTARLDLELPPRGARLSGRVLADGIPLGGARIQVRRPNSIQESAISYDGRFTVDLQEEGAVTLLVVGQGIGAVRSVQVADETEVAVEIRTGRLRGTVTGSDGAPVAGAVVRIEGWSPELQVPFAGLTLRSGPDGGFEAPRLAAGTVRITVQAPGFAASETLTEIPPGSEGTVEIRLGSVDER